MNHLSLAPVLRVLTWCLHLLVAGLLALAAGRAVVDGGPRPSAVLAASVVMAVVYAVGPTVRAVGRALPATVAWLACLGAAWLALLALTPDGVWLAFPLYFLVLHLLPRRAGLVALVVTALAAVCGYAWHQHGFTLAALIGPLLGAAVAVATVRGFQALHQESEERRQLIQQLTAARADLEVAGRTAGMMAERERLAREIHDTLAQGFSSIQLLLTAAERALDAEPDATAARYVAQARRAAQDNLAEARRFVHALVPPGLEGEGASLHAAVERLCDTTTVRHGLPVRFHLSGTPGPLPSPYEVAILRIAQSALANAVAHSEAGAVEVTLSYMDEQLALDVVDDGVGFLPDALPSPEPGRGGFGLAAMRARARALGGTLSVESAPGHGTAVAVQLPASYVAGGEFPAARAPGHRP
ncbi:sensor histidine kinase [Streptomyces sp. NPDC048172]|uniref:sensor histidine kinase n=1 Tax=Streptomyces sp. NPDC048172 TaxID=3365505 RepID=UPI003717E2FB